MTILLEWLVEHAWIFYAACGVGAAIYVIRALAAQRERSLALFTLERETATAQLIRAWAMVLVFVVIGAVVFVSTTFVLPSLPFYGAGTPRPTPTLAAGVQPPTPVITPTPSPTLGAVVSTVVLTTTSAAVPTPPPPEPTETPTGPTDVPEAAISGGVGVRFSDFAELASYSLPAAQVRAAEGLPLTLYWRGLEVSSSANYLVFTHLLSQDGRLIAQHDGPPAGGTRPTSGWVSGETITDFHPMAFYEPAYLGSATIAVGLYDPATGRVPTGAGGDSVVLPITIVVVQ